MERYFEVTEESRLYSDWFEYKANRESINEIYKQFKREQGIESSTYYVTDDEIHIIPTEKDMETFGSVLCTPEDDGLLKFRVNSKIGKAWKQALKDKGLKVLRRPMVILYFSSRGGKYRSRIFDQNGKLYCSMDPADGQAPKGFTEMKASDFYKVVEEKDTAA